MNRTGEIWGVYITPNSWRQGIGTTVVHEAERILQSRGYIEVVLSVLDENMDARRFYDKLGFCRDGMYKMVELGKPLKAVSSTKAMNIAVND